MEQLGYQAESATWRNAYLLGARELRHGCRRPAPGNVSISPDVIAVLPLGSFLDYLAIRVDGPKAQALSARIDWVIEHSDGQDADAPTDERRITMSNGALNHLPGRHGKLADATVRTTRDELARVSGGRRALQAALDSGTLRVDGRIEVLRSLIETLDEFDPMFAVVEP